MSTYPLGSFPRFGHQARWASERRSRAQMNSALTRQIQAEEHLEREQALCELFQTLLDSIHIKSPEIERAIDLQKLRLERARNINSQGKRAYYGTFGDLLHWYTRASKTHPKVQQYDRREMKDLLISLADQHLAGVEILTPANPPSEST